MPVRKILHLDMDAFFASIEQRDRPELRGKPVAVGGVPGGRGVVAAASYEARRFGVHSAMPSTRAARLCRELVFVRPDHAKYRAVSGELREIMLSVTPLIEPLSLDEAYLDVTENALELESGTQVAQHLRARVKQELALTCSVGVASQKFVAKIASDWRKPDGLTVVRPEQVLDFIHPLSVSKLWGVGPATQRRLEALGLRTIGDVARQEQALLAQQLGKHGAFLWRLANGDDPREVTPHRERKSVSAEQTFSDDIADLGVLDGILGQQAEQVCGTLRAKGLVGRTATVKVRYADFTTVTRSETLTLATSDVAVLRHVATVLLRRTEAGARPVRLVGVGLGALSAPSPSRQLALPLGVPSPPEEAR